MTTISLLLIVILPITIFVIWALIDCLTRPDNSFDQTFGSINPKIVWALIIFFTGIIGAIIYVFAAGTKAKPKQTVVQTKVADTDEGRRILEMIANGKITAAEGQRLLAALETNEQQEVTAQMRTSMPKALKIGCLLLLAMPIILVIVFLFARHGMLERRASIEQQMKQTASDINETRDLKEVYQDCLSFYNMHGVFPAKIEDIRAPYDANGRRRFDYVFISGNLLTMTNASDTVLCCSRTPLFNGKYAVLFLDGHIERVLANDYRLERTAHNSPQRSVEQEARLRLRATNSATMNMPPQVRHHPQPPMTNTTASAMDQ